MAKIGTAHIEIKPVLNEEALEAFAQKIEETVMTRIEEAIARGMVRGFSEGNRQASRTRAGR